MVVDYIPSSPKAPAPVYLFRVLRTPCWVRDLPLGWVSMESEHITCETTSIVPKCQGHSDNWDGAVNEPRIIMPEIETRVLLPRNTGSPLTRNVSAMSTVFGMSSIRCIALHHVSWARIWDGRERKDPTNDRAIAPLGAGEACWWLILRIEYCEL